MTITLEERRAKKKEELMTHINTLPPQDNKQYEAWKGKADVQMKELQQTRGEMVQDLPSKSREELEAQKKSMEEKREKEAPQRMKFKTMEQRRMENQQTWNITNANQQKPSKYQAFMDGEKKEMAQIMEQKKRDGTYQEMGR